MACEVKGAARARRVVHHTCDDASDTVLYTLTLLFNEHQTPYGGKHHVWQMSTHQG